MNPDFWCLVFRYLLIWITVSPLFRLVLTTAYIMLKPEYQTCSLFRLHLHVASVQQQMVEVCMKHSRLIDLAKTNYYKMVQVTTTNQLDDQVLQWSRKFMLSQKLSRRFCDIFHFKCETNLLILLQTNGVKNLKTDNYFYKWHLFHIMNFIKFLCIMWNKMNLTTFYLFM